ncbi:MAG: DegV family protein [Oscillospiraceae bacterium]|nr:DegV family protein [Oscillospiraceae bacterium]
MSFAVLTDTSGNLLNEQIRDYGLQVIPLTYLYDGQEHTCLDTDSFDAEDFYGRIKRGLRVTTSQISPQQYLDFFEPYVSAGQDVIYVAMSSGISGSCNSARIGAEMLREKYPERTVAVIDTRGAALGEGIIALRAAELRDRGVDTAEAVAVLEEHVEKMFNVFTVDDLMHLRRGGRLSNLSAIVGTVLNIKPLLKGNEEGKIVAFGKLRGRKKSVEALAAMYDKLVVAPEEQIVGVVHAACREDADELVALLNRNRPPKQILLADYEPVTGCHVGPGALALFFESEEGVRSYGNEGITGGLKEAMKVGENALKGLTGSESFQKTKNLVTENAKKAAETARKAGESALRAGGSAAATLSEKLKDLTGRDGK